LQPILRRVWSPRRERPCAPCRIRYQWLYVYGFAQPQNGETQWWLMPTVSIEVMQIALNHFAQAVNPNGEKYILLLADQAGWHTSEHLQLPANIELFPLPPYTPELQPAERLWPLLRESLANTSFANLDALEETLSQRCRWLSSHPDIIQSYCGYQWILNALNDTN
jgi:hypothetical protein